jgi:HEAT repeat protein
MIAPAPAQPAAALQVMGVAAPDAAVPAQPASLVPVLRAAAAAGVLEALAAECEEWKQQIAVDPDALAALQVVELLDLNSSSSNSRSSSCSSSSSSNKARKAAAWTLSHLAVGKQDVQQRIAHMPQAVERLVQLLGSSSGDEQEAAACALCSLAGSPQALQKISNHAAGTPDAVASLVQLLGSSSVIVQGAAAQTLRILADNPQALHKIAGTPDAVANLVQLLGSSSDRVHEAAACALHNMLGCAQDPEAVLLQIATVPGVAITLAQLGSSSSSQLVRHFAARALLQIFDPRCWEQRAFALVQQQLADIPNAVEELVGCLGSSNPSMQQAVLEVLLNLALDDTFRPQLAAVPAAAPALVQLLRSSSASMRQSVASFIAAMVQAGLSPYRMTMVQPIVGVLGVLTAEAQVLRSSNEAMQLAAVALLKGLAHGGEDGQLQQIACEPAAMPGLLQLLHSSNPKAQDLSAALFHQLTDGCPGRMQMLAGVQGSVRLLVQLLSSMSGSGSGSMSGSGSTASTVLEDAVCPMLACLSFECPEALMRQCTDDPGTVGQLVLLLSSSSTGTQLAAAAAALRNHMGASGFEPGNHC